MNHYNGYSDAERHRKLRALNKQLKKGQVQPATPPCDICGDPDVPVEYHSEDYSEPFIWEQYKMCRYCHRTQMHKRFRNPWRWEAFKAHVRRGGYAGDLKDQTIAMRVKRAEKAIAAGDDVTLPRLRPRDLTGNEWWERLSTDPITLTAFDARPRAKEDFRRAWEAIEATVTDTERQILKHHMNAPDHTISMQQLADLMGYQNYSAANLAYGRLARRLVEASTYAPVLREDGTPKYMTIIAHAGPANESGDFTWEMNNSAATFLLSSGHSL